MIKSIAEVIAKAVVPEVVSAVEVRIDALMDHVRIRLDSLAREALTNAFKAFDRNGDGKIDINDLWNRM